LIWLTDLSNNREITLAKFKVTLLIIAMATVTMFGQEAKEEPVWFWFATCGGPLMTLELRLDNRMVHKSTFPLCRANREAIQRGQDGRIEFTRRPVASSCGRAIVSQMPNSPTKSQANIGSMPTRHVDARRELVARSQMNTSTHPAATNRRLLASAILTYPATKYGSWIRLRRALNSRLQPTAQIVVVVVYRGQRPIPSSDCRAGGLNASAARLRILTD
jgi:hypothetical protein